MNKRIISTLLTAAMLIAVSGCSNNDNAETSTTTAAETTTTTTELTSGTTESEDAPEAEVTTDAPDEDDADAVAQTDCQKITDAVMKNDAIKDWATMQADDDVLRDVLGYDTSLFEDYSVVMHLMSAHLIEITVVKPAAGQEDAALEFLNTRKDKLINEVAFYPEQQENAEKTIVGSYGGYDYLLCFGEPEALETSLKSAIDALNG